MHPMQLAFHMEIPRTTNEKSKQPRYTPLRRVLAAVGMVAAVGAGAAHLLEQAHVDSVTAQEATGQISADDASAERADSERQMDIGGDVFVAGLLLTVVSLRKPGAAQAPAAQLEEGQLEA